MLLVIFFWFFKGMLGGHYQVIPRFFTLLLNHFLVFLKDLSLYLLLFVFLFVFRLISRSFPRLVFFIPELGDVYFDFGRAEVSVVICLFDKGCSFGVPKADEGKSSGDPLRGSGNFAVGNLIYSFEMVGYFFFCEHFRYIFHDDAAHS